MNRLNFNQSIGFPLETNILSEMQTAWSILNALGSIAGNFTILQGCTVIGTTVRDGVVFINGEVIEFKGGQLQENVIIVETPTVLEFEDNSEKEVIYTRFATFGVATTQYPWSGFKRFKNAVELTEDKAENTTIDALIERIEDLEGRPVANVPVGLIAIWGQAANLIPEGWAEYTPLRGRMAVGFDSSISEFDVLGDFGGAVNKTLTESEIPTLHIDGSNDDNGGHGSLVVTSAQQPNDGFDLNTGGQSFSLMNPYRVVLYIQYVG